jgi:hypothetical protein
VCSEKKKIKNQKNCFFSLKALTITLTPSALTISANSQLVRPALQTTQKRTSLQIEDQGVNLL